MFNIVVKQTNASWINMKAVVSLHKISYIVLFTSKYKVGVFRRTLNDSEFSDKGSVTPEV